MDKLTKSKKRNKNTRDIRFVCLLDECKNPIEYK